MTEFGFHRQPDGRYTHQSGWFIVKASRRGWWSIEHDDPARMIVWGETVRKRLDYAMTCVLNRIDMEEAIRSSTKEQPCL